MLILGNRLGSIWPNPTNTWWNNWFSVEESGKTSQSKTRGMGWTMNWLPTNGRLRLVMIRGRRSRQRYLGTLEEIVIAVKTMVGREPTAKNVRLNGVVSRQRNAEVNNIGKGRFLSIVCTMLCLATITSPIYDLVIISWILNPSMFHVSWLSLLNILIIFSWCGFSTMLAALKLRLPRSTAKGSVWFAKKWRNCIGRMIDSSNLNRPLGIESNMWSRRYNWVASVYFILLHNCEYIVRVWPLFRDEPSGFFWPPCSSGSWFVFNLASSVSSLLILASKLRWMRVIEDGKSAATNADTVLDTFREECNLYI